mmetsp:Transcript_2245/g.5829  ORF Transcript_2245/g.5829 Transcript_2245/m.5829 type:complete len:110 (-) Transcript_2245:4-333(-)
MRWRRDTMPTFNALNTKCQFWQPTTKYSDTTIGKVFKNTIENHENRIGNLENETKNLQNNCSILAGDRRVIRHPSSAMFTAFVSFVHLSTWHWRWAMLLRMRMEQSRAY